MLISQFYENLLFKTYFGKECGKPSYDFILSNF